MVSSCSPFKNKNSLIGCWLSGEIIFLQDFYFKILGVCISWEFLSILFHGSQHFEINFHKLNNYTFVFCQKVKILKKLWNAAWFLWVNNQSTCLGKLFLNKRKSLNVFLPFGFWIYCDFVNTVNFCTIKFVQYIL